MSRKSNVVVVVLDTARATDALSTSPTVMPTLSALGEKGTAYRNAFASAPWTLPSHASLFTGTYPSKHGAHGDHTYLDERHRTLPEAFAAGGYETLAVSNNTWVTAEFGFDRGFETFWKGWQYLQSDADLGPIAHELGPLQKARAAADRLRQGNPLINAVNLCYDHLIQPRTDDGADRTTDRIQSWLGDRRDDRPFFLFVNYLEPHAEYRPPREETELFLPEDASYDEALSVRQDPCAYNVGQYDLDDRDLALLRALYRGELAYVDAALDRLRTALREAGEWEDTLLVVLGDHGENVGEHGFLGHQYNIYDTLLHVPLVVHGGAFVDGAGNAEELVQIPDVVPTLLDAAGLDAHELREQCQGRSFHPDAADSRDHAISEYIAPQPSVGTLEERFGDLPDYAYDYDRTLRTIRTHEYKLVRGSDGHEELYHVAIDPAERTDRSEDDPGRVEALGKELDAWLSSFDHADPSGEVAVADTTEERLSDLGYM